MAVAAAFCFGCRLLMRLTLWALMGRQSSDRARVGMILMLINQVKMKGKAMMGIFGVVHHGKNIEDEVPMSS